jgi:acetyl esterase/lipase
VLGGLADIIVAMLFCRQGMGEFIVMAIDVRNGFTYATHDGVALQGDLYLPGGKGPSTALVAVHGGGWQVGARSQFQYWGPYLAERGIALFTISYRLAKKGVQTFPHAVHDVLGAVRFLRARAGEFGIDPERIGLMGASAGAHLSALAALGVTADVFARGAPAGADTATSAKVKVMVGVYGVYDVKQMWDRYRLASPLDNNIENFLGAAPIENRKLYFDASPISYATLANNRIAVLLSVGTEDDLVDRATQTDAFLLALKQAGFFVRPCVVPGAPHYWMSDPIDEPGSFSGFLAPRLLRFLAERL